MLYTCPGFLCPTCMTLHFATLNSIPQVVDHSTSPSRAFCSFSLSSNVLISCPSFVSSANFLNTDSSFKISSMSSMYIVKYVGPRTLPCIIPESTGAHSDSSPFTSTLCSLFFSQFSVHTTTSSLTCFPLIFWTRRLCGTLSKAFARSRKTMSTGPPLSVISVVFSKNSSKFVAQDLFSLNPCWLSVSNPFFSRCSTTSSLIMCSNSLQHTEVSATGL